MFKGILEPENTVLIIPHTIITKTQINGSQKFPIHICQLLMKGVILDCFFNQCGIFLSHQLVIDPDAVIC